MSAGDEYEYQERSLSQLKNKYPGPNTTSKFNPNISQRQQSSSNDGVVIKSRAGKIRKFKNNVQKRLKYSNTQTSHDKMMIHHDISTGSKSLYFYFSSIIIINFPKMRFPNINLGSRRFSKVSKLEPYNLLAIPNVNADFLSSRLINKEIPLRSFTNSTSKPRSERFLLSQNG